jgi:hypothetical protein
MGYLSLQASSAGDYSPLFARLPARVFGAEQGWGPSESETRQSLIVSQFGREVDVCGGQLLYEDGLNAAKCGSRPR